MPHSQESILYRIFPLACVTDSQRMCCWRAIERRLIFRSLRMLFNIAMSVYSRAVCSKITKGAFSYSKFRPFSVQKIWLELQLTGWKTCSCNSSVTFLVWLSRHLKKHKFFFIIIVRAFAKTVSSLTFYVHEPQTSANIDVQPNTDTNRLRSFSKIFNSMIFLLKSRSLVKLTL